MIKSLRRGIILILLLIWISACSEKTKIESNEAEAFVKIFSNGLNDVGNDVKQKPDEGYVITGTTTSPTTQKNSAFFIETDKFGNPIGKQQVFENEFNSEGNSVALTPDGGYVIAGTINSANEGTDVLVIKLDASGNVLWNKTYDTLHLDDDAYYVRMNSVGNIVLTGSAKLDDLANGYGKQLWFLELNPNDGSIVNSIFVGNQFYSLSDYSSETGKYIELLPESNQYLVIGTTTTFDGKQSKIFFAKIRVPGGILSGRTAFITNTTKNESGTSVAFLEDIEKYLVLGSSTESNGYQQINLTLLNDTLVNTSNFQQFYLGDQSVQYEACCMKRAKDGNFAILSNRIIAGNSDIDILKVDAYLNKLSSTEHWYGDNKDQIASAFDFTSDGGYIIVGINKPTDKKSEIVLIKTSAEGTFR